MCPHFPYTRAQILYTNFKLTELKIRSSTNLYDTPPSMKEKKNTVSFSCNKSEYETFLVLVCHLSLISVSLYLNYMENSGKYII